MVMVGLEMNLNRDNLSGSFIRKGIWAKCKACMGTVIELLATSKPRPDTIKIHAFT